MPGKVARIAVSAATYAVDRPFEYSIPEELSEKVCEGMRVFVPFSSGNRICEGIVLAVSDEARREKLKAIVSVPDEGPVLSAEQIRLALFMRERFFCTVYDAVNAMLPAGMWFSSEGKRRVSDKTVEVARLGVSADEARELAAICRRKAPARAAVLDELASYEEMPVRELLTFAGTTRQPLKALTDSGVVELYEREVFRRPEVFSGELSALPELNAGQQAAFEGLEALMRSSKNETALLQGVTGSGKTAVYIRLIARALEEGKSAVLLVPEIALTPQMLRTFSSYFGNEIAVLHSKLSAGERCDEWKRVRSGLARLVIGTRSAVFAPVGNPGIFIIDEEQEDSYKSENTPRYNALDVARYRCYKSGCLLLLGSATPDVCTRYLAETGEIAHFMLTERYNEQELPAVKTVDMKAELKAGNEGCISRYLRDEIQKNIDSGEQSILFLNRRGARKLITCGECGYVYSCPRCSVSLTYHSVNDSLICHYCGYRRKPDSSCPECGGILKSVGAGTQLVEQELRELFPGAETLRLDADVIGSGQTHEQVLDRFRRENIPLLVGTQMVTKGLNFENVTLVGVVSADQSLYCSDYRAAEKTFSIITQVIGRSGRGSRPGRAVIQSFTPDNEVIRLAAAQDYEEFYASEIRLRRLQDSPPFAGLVSITVSGEKEAEVVNGCRYALSCLKLALAERENTDFLGPTPLPVVRVNNRYRYRVTLRCRVDSEVRNAVASTVVACGKVKELRKLSFFADNDPE